MKASIEQINKLLAGEKIGKSKYSLDDSVIKTNGKHSGKTCRVVSIET